MDMHANTTHVETDVAPEDIEPVRKAEGRFHHGDLRIALLAQASRLISTRGSMDVSLRELARLLGVTHAATYRHFSSKGDLLAALAIRAQARLEALVAERTTGAEPGPAALAIAGETYGAFALANPGAYRTMTSAELRAASPALEAASSAFAASIQDLVASGQGAGAVRGDVPADMLARLLIACWHGVTLQAIDSGASERAGGEARTALALLLGNGMRMVAPAAVTPKVAPQERSLERPVERKPKPARAAEPMTLDLFG